MGKISVGDTAAHELAHAEHFAELLSHTGNLAAARNAFFISDTTVRYALREIYTEAIALSRIEQHLGGVSAQQIGHSTRYISTPGGGWLDAAGLPTDLTIADFR